MTVIRPTRAYVLVSAVALAGMAGRMDWVGETQFGVALFILCVIVGVGLLIGILFAVTWVFIKIMVLIFGGAAAPPAPPVDARYDS